MAVVADTDKQAARERRDREMLLALFLLLLTDTEHELTASASAYFAGTLSIYALSDAWTSTLMDAHAHAAYLGRRLAGSRKPFGRADAAFAATVLFGQFAYLHRLVADVETGRYTVTVTAEAEASAVSGALANRLRLYALRLRGTAQQAWLMTLPADALVWWRLGQPETMHCDDCPERAKNSPYLASQIPWTPSDGTSECGCACLCWLETANGVTSFQAP